MNKTLLFIYLFGVNLLITFNIQHTTAFTKTACPNIRAPCTIFVNSERVFYISFLCVFNKQFIHTNVLPFQYQMTLHTRRRIVF